MGAGIHSKGAEVCHVSYPSVAIPILAKELFVIGKLDRVHEVQQATHLLHIILRSRKTGKQKACQCSVKRILYTSSFEEIASLGGTEFGDKKHAHLQGSSCQQQPIVDLELAELHLEATLPVLQPGDTECPVIYCIDYFLLIR